MDSQVVGISQIVNILISQSRKFSLQPALPNYLQHVHDIYINSINEDRASNQATAAMSKKKRDKGDDVLLPREKGGLADTNCGLVLDDIVRSRSWPVVVLAILLVSIFARAAVGLGGFSGTPPAIPTLQ